MLNGQNLLVIGSIDWSASFVCGTSKPQKHLIETRERLLYIAYYCMLAEARGRPIFPLRNWRLETDRLIGLQSFKNTLVTLGFPTDLFKRIHIMRSNALLKCPWVAQIAPFTMPRKQYVNTQCATQTAECGITSRQALISLQPAMGHGDIETLASSRIKQICQLS